ncbi:MAG: hypothetical protein LBK26_02475 [Rickettsiales bacterium]|nr:hypothetical protein [Rickettsiales bacterium]
MSRQIQIRRGTASEHAGFTGAAGEITMDTTNKTLRLHDGETTGGMPLARISDLGTIEGAAGEQGPQGPQGYQGAAGPQGTAGAALPDGADYVVEFCSTASAWYRKYKSGWVEQGGITAAVAANANIAITFSVVMAGNSYNASYIHNGSNHGYVPRIISKTATGMTMAVDMFTSASSSCTRSWIVCGMSANG